MNHSQFPVDEVKVEATLFSRGVDKLRFAFAVSDFETASGFHDPKDGDESFGDLIFLGDVLGELVFSLSEFHFGVGAGELLGIIFGVLNDTFSMFVHKFPEVFDEGIVVIEESNHRLGITEGQIPLKNEAIKTIDTSLDFVVKMLYKRVHGVSGFGG